MVFEDVFILICEIYCNLIVELFLQMSWICMFNRLTCMLKKQPFYSPSLEKCFSLLCTDGQKDIVILSKSAWRTLFERRTVQLLCMSQTYQFLNIFYYYHLVLKNNNKAAINIFPITFINNITIQIQSIPFTILMIQFLSQKLTVLSKIFGRIIRGQQL